MAVGGFTIDTFSSGINQTADVQLIEVFQAREAENCDITTGTLKRSKGSTRYSTAQATNPISSLMKYHTGGSGHILAASGGSVYKLIDNTLASVSSGFTSDDFDYMNYQSDVLEMMIFGNGTEPTKVYDGVTLRDLKFNGKDTTAGSNNRAPKGKYIELHKERMWIAGDPNSPNTLSCSTPFDADDWTAPVTEEAVNMHGWSGEIPTWDGGKIIGLKSIFDNMLVFKNKNVFRIFGLDPSNFGIHEVFNTVTGDIVDKTIAGVDSVGFWLSTDGIYMFDGASSIKISRAVDDYWKTVNTSAIHKSRAMIYNNKYIAFVPTGESDVPNMAMEYDIHTGSFVIRKPGGDIHSMIEWENKLILGMGDGTFIEYDSGDTYNGTPISAFWKTGDITLDRQNARKTLERLYFVARGEGKLYIECSTERKTVTRSVDLTSELKDYQLRIRNKGRRYSFKFYNDNGNFFELKQPQFVFDVDED